MHLYMVYILAHGLGESIEDQHKAWSEQTCMRIGGCACTHERVCAGDGKVCVVNTHEDQQGNIYGENHVQHAYDVLVVQQVDYGLLGHGLRFQP